MKCEWEMIAFGDILEEPVRNGLTKPKAIRGTGVKMIAMGEIFAYSRIANVVTDRVPVTEKELQNCSIKPLDILFARQSLTLEGAGKCSIVTDVLEDTVFESHLIRTRVNQEKADPFFLYYYFNSPYGKENIKSIVEQVAAAGIRGSDLIKLSVPYPCLEKQRKISAILRSLDDKIELNNKINENLEQQAALLVERYIRSIGNTVPLSEIMCFDNGFAFQSKNYLPSGKYRVITIKNVQDGFIDSTGAAFIDSVPQNMKACCFLHTGDVLLSLTGNVGRVGIVCENNLLLNQRVAKFMPFESDMLPFLYFFFRQPIMKSKLETIAKGTAQLNLSPVETLRQEIPYEKETAKACSQALNPLYRAIISNNQQNFALKKLRDNLLPKLMNGEIEIK